MALTPMAFDEIIKNHPELAKNNEPKKQEEKKLMPGDAGYSPFFSPFTKPKKQEEVKKPEVSADSFIISKEENSQPTSIKAVVVVNEDSSEDDPALIAVANRPLGKIETGTVTVNNERVKKAPVVEESKTEESKEDLKTEEVKTEEPIKEEPKRKRSRKETKADEPKVEGTLTVSDGDKKFRINDVCDFDVIAKSEERNPEYFEKNLAILQQRYFDEKFVKFRDELYQRERSIVIPSDINPGTSKVKLAEIAALRDELLSHSTDIKMMLCMIEKSYGDVKVNGKLNSIGSNESERVRNYFKCISNFPVNGTNVDVPYIATILSMYEVLYNEVISLLEAKVRIIMTATGNNKIDAMLTS